MSALGLIADRRLGEPPAVLHPVAMFGNLMHGFEKLSWSDQRWRGLLHATAGISVGVAAGAVVPSVALSVWLMSSGRLLGHAAIDVALALGHGELEEAKRLLPALVGRNTSELDEAGVCRAVIESVAENTVDAVVAPGFWGAAVGAWGATAHRAADTMDSMVGYRNSRYENYGWASARLDDVAAWIPARLAVGLVAVVRPWKLGRIVRDVLRDASAHPSPNAGLAETAFAAALGLRLGGPNQYGDPCDDARWEDRPVMGSGSVPSVNDIARAVALSRDVTVALAVLLSAPILVSSLVSMRNRSSERTKAPPAGTSQSVQSWRFQ